MSKLMRKVKRNFKRKKMKNNLLFEMADDFMDIVHNAKLYKKINKAKRKMK
ncbi:hypothetical protein [Clostridium tertium]|uniref:hypothetical protein n=1 Tax=Clostridium tertium TaxID=1559 RepID=UPI002027C7B8|nr:hypothetical protein [Clostridium tertium]